MKTKTKRTIRTVVGIACGLGILGTIGCMDTGGVSTAGGVIRILVMMTIAALCLEAEP